MLNVDLHNILSEEEAAGQIRDLFERVASSKEVVAITRAGHPALALIEVTKLEELLGMKMQTESSAMPPELPAAPATAPVTETPTLAPAPMPDLPPLPDMPAMPNLSSMPSTPSAPLMSTPPSPSMAAPSALPQNDSPMNEPAPMMDSALPSMNVPPVTPPAAPAATTPPTAAQAPVTPTTAPVPPMPIMSHFGEDLPDMPSDPSNGSPLA